MDGRLQGLAAAPLGLLRDQVQAIVQGRVQLTGGRQALVALIGGDGEFQSR